MNSQTAITLLKNLEQSLDDYCELNDEGKTAFSMAITALELFGISEQLPSVHPELSNNSPELDIKNGELISRQAAIDAIVHCTNCGTEEELRGYVVKHYLDNGWTGGVLDALDAVEGLPSTQPDRLTDDDFETIRIHLNSYKEKLCNQKRWEEAEEYQRIIDRFTIFASAQSDSYIVGLKTLDALIQAAYRAGKEGRPLMVALNEEVRG